MYAQSAFVALLSIIAEIRVAISQAIVINHLLAIQTLSTSSRG